MQNELRLINDQVKSGVKCRQRDDVDAMMSGCSHGLTTAVPAEDQIVPTLLWLARIDRSFPYMDHVTFETPNAGNRLGASHAQQSAKKHGAVCHSPSNDKLHAKSTPSITFLSRGSMACWVHISSITLSIVVNWA